MKILSMMLVLLTALPYGSAPAAKKQYALADLSALLKTKEYPEFFMHAKDISPADRNGKWQTMILDASSAMGNEMIAAKKCDALWARLMDIEASFAFVSTQAAYSSVVKKAGFCYLGLNQSYSISSDSEMDPVAKRLLRDDPAAIVDLVLQTRYKDRSAYLTEYLSKNADKFKANQKLAQYLINYQPMQGEETLFKTTLDKLGLSPQYIAGRKAKFNQVIEEMANGDKTHDHELLSLVPALRALGGLDQTMSAEYAVVRFMYFGYSFDHKLMSGPGPYRIRDKLAQQLMKLSPSSEKEKDFKELLEKLGLTQKYLAGQREQARKIVDEYVQGDNSHELDLSGPKRVLESFQAFDGQLAADFSVAQALVSSSRFEQYRPELQKLGKSVVSIADKKIAAARPKEAFWFGSGEDQWKQLLPEVKKTFPAVYASALAECTNFVKSKKKTIHISDSNCELFVPPKKDKGASADD